MAWERLFLGPTMDEVARLCEEAAIRAVMAFTEAELLTNSLEQLVQAVIADKVPQPIQLNTANHTMTSEVVSNPVRGGLSHDGIYIRSAKQPGTEAIKIYLYVPYKGVQQAFTYRPSFMPPVAPKATVTDREVILSVTTDLGLAARDVEQQLLDQEKNLVQWVDRVNTDIRTLEPRIRSLVRGRLAQRVAVLRQRDTMAAGFAIPVRQVTPDRALDVPIRRTTVTLSTSSAPADSGSIEWHLIDAVYEQMIKTITSFTHALERRPASASLLLPDEETLRDWLMFLLCTNYEAPDGSEIFVGGETVNGTGKTDILVRHQGRNAFIGECKFWHGPAKFREAIDQLLGYTVWRDTKAAIILFITSRNATAAIDRASECLVGHPACRRAQVSPEPQQRRDYHFVSPEDDQRIISLALLPVVVPATG